MKTIAEKPIAELAKELLEKNKYADYKSNSIKVKDESGNVFTFLFSSSGYNEYTQYVFKCHSDLYERPIMFSITTISESFDFRDIEYDSETVSEHEETLRRAIELALSMEALR